MSGTFCFKGYGFTDDWLLARETGYEQLFFNKFSF